MKWNINVGERASSGWLQAALRRVAENGKNKKNENEYKLIRRYNGDAVSVQGVRME